MQEDINENLNRITSSLKDVSSSKGSKRHEAIEQKLTEDYFTQIAGITNHVFWLTQLEPEQVLYVSPAFERIWGRSASELYSDPRLWTKTIHPDDRERVNSAFDEWLRNPNHHQYHVEYRIVRPDSSISWISDSGNAIRDDTGRLCRVVGVAEEITERKKMEDTLQKERERLLALINSIHDEIWFADSAGQFTLVNPSGNCEFNLDANAVTDVRQLAASLEVLRPDGSPRPIEDTPPLRALRGETVKNEEEMIRTPATEELRYRQVSATPVRGSGGNIIGSVSIVHDITERKQMEKDLRHSEYEKRMILDSANEIIAYHDKEHNLIWANKAYLDGTGLSLEQIKGKKCYHAWGLDKLCNNCPVIDAIKTDKTGSFELTPQNQPHWPNDQGSWFVTASPVKDSTGKIIGAIEVLHDITEQKRAEEQIKNLAKFPEENPFPVLRIKSDGTILYSNKPGQVLLEQWNCETGNKAPGDWCRLISKALKSKRYLVKELNCDKKIFSFAIAPVVEEGYVNLYGRDITKRKQVEDALRKSRDELDLKVKQRTADLAQTVTALQEEVRERTAAETKLKESTRDLDAFFSNTITPLVILDREFNFIRVNKAYADACRRDISDFDGHNHFEFYPHEENRRIFEEVVTTKTLYQASAKPFTFPDHPEWGVTYWDWTLVPILGDGGEVELLIFSLNDVTERQRAEKAVKESEEKYRSFVESSPEAVCVVIDEKIDFVNTAALKLMNAANVEELNGKSMWDFIHPDSIEVVGRDIKELLEKKGKVPPREIKIICLDGSMVEVEASATSIVHKGKPSLLVMFSDITESKRAREMVKAERQRMNDVLETLPAYVCLLTPDYQMPFANRVFRETFGYSPDKKCYEFLFNRIEPCEICETYTVLKTNKPHRWEWTGPNGRDYDVFDFPFKDTDGSQLILEMGMDITERKRVEERIRTTNSLLEQFATKISRKEYLDSVVEIIRDWSGCRCVGLRLTNSEGYIPYASCVGFDKEFISLESNLSLNEDVCACIRVIAQTPEPQEAGVMTERGSFRCDNTFNFVASLSENEKKRFRGNCLKAGFASVAVVPVRYRQNILGAIHIADEGRNKVPLETVKFLEDMAALIGEAVHRFNVEESLVLNERRLLDAQRVAHLGNWEWDIIKNRLWWSDEVYRIFGVEPGQFGATYDAFLSYVHPDDREFVKKSVNEALYDGKVYNIDHRVIRPDDSERIVHEQSEVLRDLEGKPIRMMGTVQDVTKLKQKEEQLKESEERFRLLAESIEDVFWMSTPGIKEMIYVSPAFEKIWGRSRESLYAHPQSFIDTVHPDDRQQLVEGLERHAQGKWDFEYRIVRPDGSSNWIRDRGFPILDEEGNLHLMCGVATDISVHKQAEERILADQAALRSLTSELQLVEERERRRIAQDLHDSIGQILAFSCGGLKHLQKSLPEEAAKSLQKITNQLDSAVEQTRTLSFDLSPSTLYDLGFEIAVEDLVDRISKERNIQCHFENCRSAKPLAQDVKVLLYRSVRELLINAVKHAKAGIVKVSLLRSSSDIYIMVEDDGSGFDVSVLDKDSTKRKGFGIFSIRERLSHIGGVLKIESAKGKGTKAVLIAPLDIEKGDKQELIDEYKNNTG